MSSSSSKRSSKRAHYVAAAKRAKHAKYRMTEGLRGFLLTCNHREKEAIREGYNVLNKYADQRYGGEDREEKGREDADLYKDAEGRESGEDEDVDSALEREVAALKKVSARPPSERRFQIVESGVQNVLFIKTSLERPAEIITDLLEDLERTREQQTRYLLRLVPVQLTCKAFFDNVKEAAKKILPDHFEGKGEISYQIMFKARLNNSFPKEEAYKAIGEAIRDINSMAKVDFKASDVFIVCEAMKAVVCLSVVKDYFRFKKYNLIEVVGNHQDDRVKSKEVRAPGAEVPEEDCSSKEETKKENTDEPKEESKDEAQQ